MFALFVFVLVVFGCFCVVCFGVLVLFLLVYELSRFHFLQTSSHTEGSLPAFGVGNADTEPGCSMLPGVLERLLHL